MNIISNLKIRDKLILLLSLLLIPLVYFVVSAVQLEFEENESLKQEALQLEESEKISTLIHLFQRERARMLAAAVGDSAMLLEAKIHRSSVDAAERELKTFLQNSGRSLPELSLLDEQRKYRADLDEQKLDLAQYRVFSSSLIFNLLDRLDDNASATGNGDLARQLISFRYLTEAKIQLARARSLLQKVAFENNFTYDDYATIRSHINSYNRALSNFSRYAEPVALADVEEILVSDNYRYVLSMLQAIEQNPDMDLNAVDPGIVFERFTTSIESFREAERSLVNRIRNEVDE
ncbi:MAG: nitrate- and nitrite sensing domain-containing protein, partial [Pontibacter sp.]|nr:nitrate- and nitrite sensing domain-containing protein [Pontibacter sp.]